MKMTNELLVKMMNIDKWYGRVHALKNVNLTVRHNEVLGLVGDNGAGKSTLIKILSGYHKPDKGQIWFDGTEVDFKSPADARKLGIETVYQDQALVSSLTIAKNIFMGREETRMLGLIDEKKMKAESMKALGRIELHLRSPDIPVESLSGGERQGVALARALYFSARLIILDEPTAALSIKEAQKILEFVRLIRDEGISVIFITHNLYHVFPVADRFTVLAHGEKVGDVEKEGTSIDELSKLIISR